MSWRVRVSSFGYMCLPFGKAGHSFRSYTGGGEWINCVAARIMFNSVSDLFSLRPSIENLNTAISKFYGDTQFTDVPNAGITGPG